MIHAGHTSCLRCVLSSDEVGDEGEGDEELFNIHHEFWHDLGRKCIISIGLFAQEHLSGIVPYHNPTLRTLDMKDDGDILNEVVQNGNEGVTLQW